MKLAAIPTTYKRINFRSRLEARWAAFFDALGWEWDYEQIDLTGWIPDFTLHGALHEIYVEVKPISLRASTKEWRAAFSKTLPHATDAHILWLGLSPLLLVVGDDNALAFGMCNEPGSIDPETNAPIADTFDYAVPQLFGYCHRWCDYTDRISGAHKSYPDIGDRSEADAVMPKWAEACNRSQWTPR